MSWLVATLGADSGIADQLHARPTSESTTHSKTPLFEARIGDVRISAGGSLRTCHFGWLSPEREAAWVVLGTGVGVPKHTPGPAKRILDSNDWSMAVVQPGSIQKNIEGQYVVLIAQRDNLYCLADPVGLRDLFVASNDRTTFVTSRLDWLTSVSLSPAINANAFGGRWHFFYQLSYDAIIDGVRRLGPGGVAQLTDRTSRFTRFEWQDSKAEDQLEEVMTELALAPGRSGLPIDLALSGGVDSRLLFGIYATSDLERWSTHTFGSPETTDAVIARSLASSYGIPHKQYYHPFDLHAVERTLIEFASQGMMLRPASTCLDLQYFDDAASESACIVDGSFGELARRQMLKRISLFGRKALANKDYRKLFKHLQRSRADIFEEEFSKRLTCGAIAQLDDLGVSMPHSAEIGVGNWLDLLVMKHGIPNVVAAEQARIDHIGLTFSPFVQPDFFRGVLATPLADRRNARLIKRWIKRLSPQLARSPLAGPRGAYPFGLSPMLAYLHQSIGAKVSRSAALSSRDQFLHAAKDLVMGTLHSRSVRECGLYDPLKVRRVLEGYYEGNTSLGSQLDWLLAFELWRRANRVKG